MKKYLFLASLVAFIFTGCGNKNPIPIDVDKTKNIRVKAKEITIIDKTKLAEQKTIIFSDSEQRTPQITQQFKKNIEETITSTLSYDGDKNYKFIVNIEDSDIYFTLKGIKTIPFVGILALGMDEDVVANISLLVEVEDSNGRVVASTPIKIQSKATSSLANEEDFRARHSEAMSLALKKMQDEIIKQSNRLLYNYLSK